MKELESYFPQDFSDPHTLLYLRKIQQRNKLLSEKILKGVDNSAKIKEIDNFFIKTYKPKEFYGKNSFEIKFDKDFELLSLLITKEIGTNAKDMTVMEFYCAKEYINQRQEQLKKLQNRRKK
jgi:hypothetical protein